MPIASTQSMLQTQIKAALSLGSASQSDVVASLVSGAIASAVPSGVIPSAPPITLVPLGLQPSLEGMRASFKLGPAAQPDVVATLIAQSVSIMAPMAPPTGLTLLQSQLSTAFKKGQSATVDAVAADIANAVIQYYLAGGVI